MKEHPVTKKVFNKIHWGSPTKLYLKRPSSTCYRDKATIANGNDVIAGYRLRVFGVGVYDQRTNATPRCQHVSSSHCPEPKISQSQPGTDGYLSHIPPVVFVALPPCRYSLWNKDCTTPCLLVEQLKELEKILQSNEISWATELKIALPWSVSVIFCSPKQSQRQIGPFFTLVQNLTEHRYPGNWSTKRDSTVKLTDQLKKTLNSKPKPYHNQHTHPSAKSSPCLLVLTGQSLHYISETKIKFVPH